MMSRKSLTAIEDIPPIGWVSATPIATTGYGRITREIGYRLIDMGVKVTFIGSHGDMVIWGGTHEQLTPKGNPAKILPLTDPGSAPVILNTYARKYGFKMLVGFMDCFGIEFLNNVDTPVIGYVPIDGPWTRDMCHFVRNFTKVVAYSKFGFGELQKFFPPTKIGRILHGVDHDKFKPLSSKEYDDAREWLSRLPSDEEGSANYAPPIPKGCKLFMDLSANIGERKCLPQLMQTFAKFVEQHPSDPPHLLLQTNPYSPDPRSPGYNLVSHRINLNMEPYIHFPRYDPIIYPASDEHLRRIYGSSLAFVHNAVAEGFGLPLAEAMSCGIPAIAPNNSAQKEFVEDNGWLVENVEGFTDWPLYVPTLQEYPVPDQRSLLEKLNEAYNNPEEAKEKGKKSRQYIIENCSWDRIMQEWIQLLTRTQRQLDISKSLVSGLKGIL